MTKRKTNEQYQLELLDTDYEALEEYKNGRTKILHLCLACQHEWLVRPQDILNGKRCPKCAIKGKKTHETYIREIEHLEYETLEPYDTIDIKITHRHKICGHEWLVRPHDILTGYGCPECALYGPTKANIVYLMHFPELELYKVGRSNNPKRRAGQFGVKADIVWIEEYPSYLEATAREKELLEGVTLVNTGLLKSGNTETFYEINDKIKRL